MFKSKIHSIVIPQYEHSRLAGTLAARWGNTNFEQPDIDFAAFVEGVALHDWHYGVIDDLPIGEADEADWLAVTHAGVAYRFDNPVTDIVVKLHLKRLLSGQITLETAPLIEQIEAYINKRLPETVFSREQFEWADKITGFCDMVAFDFSFQVPTEAARPVFSKTGSSEETLLTYTLKPGGKIEVEPWPFSGDNFLGIITGYQQVGFPNELTPLVIPFEVCKRK